MTKRLFLLDAYALIYRSYFAFIRNPRYNSKGLNTSAIFGFVNTLIDILKNENPTHIAVAFDTSEPTFRHTLYPEYKAQREETPEDIRKSISYIKNIINAFNITLIEVPGFEADDIIGTIAKQAETKNFNVFMLTPDKDFGQLVSDKIFLYKPSRGDKNAEILGVNEIKQIYSIDEPSQLIDILALWGDASDNIKGAQNIGEKTSKELIAKYKSIENLFNHLDELKPKQKENLEKSFQQVLFAKQLVTINTNVPINFDEESFKINKPNITQLKELFNELEFKTTLERIVEQNHESKYVPIIKKNNVAQQNDLFSSLENSIPENNNITQTTINYYKTINDIPHNYILVDNEEAKNQLIKELSACTEFCFDTETSSVNVHQTDLVGIAFCIKPYTAYYIPIPINKEQAIIILNTYKPFLENETIKKIGQNIKFDIQVLNQYNIKINGKLFDTMIAHYIIEPELNHNMNFLSETYLQYSPISIETLIGKKGKNQQSMRFVPIEKVCEYACEDADITLQLKYKLEKELEKYGVIALANNIEMPLIYVLTSMELSGVKINTTELNNYAEILVSEINKIEQKIYELAGEQFNISSPKQLGIILFDKLKIASDTKLTATKQYSTSEEILEQYYDKHPIVPAILEYRSLNKLKTTYVEALPKLINPITSKIHTSFNQAIVSTGRLSSTNPNLQNIPIRTEKGREIRKAFIPSSENNVYLSADYSQIELRVMAHISNDENMIAAFNNNKDIHNATAAKIYNIPEQDVTPEMRRNAKTANFGIIYGISAFGLASRLSISRTDAKKLIDSYFNTYPRIKEYMDKTIAFARNNGYVETILGRRRYLKDINSRNAMVRSFAERNAINTPIQGTAADIIKIAMINIYNEFNYKSLKSKMILQVHDELNFDVLKSELSEVKEIVENKMQNAIKLQVPLIVDIGIGNNWLEAH